MKDAVISAGERGKRRGFVGLRDFDFGAGSSRCSASSIQG
jgi:hypothetical protein